MIKSLLCIFAGLTIAEASYAQAISQDKGKMSEEDSIIVAYNTKKTDVATMDLHLVYIDHEMPPATPAAQLCTRIDKLRRDAAETGNPLIIYLANEESPMLSFTNLNDPEPVRHRDSIDAFYEIVDAIQSVPSHEVNADTDIKALTGLIGIAGSYPLFDESNGEGAMRFKSITIDFYIGPRFWLLRHNENVIAQLYTILRLSKYMAQYPRRKLSFNVFKAQGQVLEYPEGMPFGQHNKDGINNNTKVNVIKEY